MKRTWIVTILALAMLALWPAGDALSQYVTSTMQPPPPPPVRQTSDKKTRLDSIDLQFGVQPTVPGTYDDITRPHEYSIDLKDPSNIKTEAEYDYQTGTYVIHTKLGDQDIVTPFILSADEYNNIAVRQSMMEYYRQKNSESVEEKKKNPFNFLDMQFGLGPLDKIFGPGGVQLKTQGSVTVNMGIKSNKTDNPALSVAARKKTYFDFEQKIQANVTASVGDKMHFNMSYNTAATFDFDTKNLKLAYEGKEDEIIKSIEAGNVSMTTGSSLIRGSAALFGVKAKLQFGKLTATALVSQQNSESQTVNTKGGAQTTEFYVTADKYDQNRNYFLSHFFRDNYDQWCSKLPLVSSGIDITRIEVWITNKRSNYSEARNLVAFMDMGEAEAEHLACRHWYSGGPIINPSNQSNNLLTEIKNDYEGARYISEVATVLKPLETYGFEGGRDYEKIESARILTSSEYTLNSTLGYIQLKQALGADETLAVAYQYKYNGKVYQVGEFSGDITATDQAIYVKMLKGTTVSPQLPAWHLMMKNIYSLGAYQIQKNNFKLNIKYLSDTTGTELTFLSEGAIAGKPLLQVMNLDRLDANGQENIDGRFDYLEGYTVNSSTGKIIFPVVEPFGSHLRSKIGSDAIADKYVYQELYDSTLTVARQHQDKNKFVLQGEYQASSGNTIKLNAMNVPRGSVVVTAGGVTLTENSDYTVDYNMGQVTITNQSIIDAGTPVSVTLENQSTFSMQRKTLLGLDLDYAFNKNFHIGGTLMHYGEKALTEKVSIGDELVNNTIWGVNTSYSTRFMWLTNLLNKIPTVNATAPSTFTFKGEFAQLIPHKSRTGSNAGSSYIDDFETTQSGIDLRSPYSWFLASTPYDSGSGALFPEAGLTNNIDYGKNRSLLAWYYIDRLFTQRNSSYVPGYIKNDLDQLSNPYVREVPYTEVFPGRELNYGESSTIQTLNLSFYPKERGPYNLDADNIDADGNLLNPEKRWGGIMRKLDNTNFEQSNIEYIQFWMLDPFIDETNPNRDGGYLYFNLGEVSEDILKDGLKSYENGLPTGPDDTQTPLRDTEWGRVSDKTSMTYAFDNAAGSRVYQDLGLNGLSTAMEQEHDTYREYVRKLRAKLSPTTIAAMEEDPFSPLNDPGGDNYHFYRGYDFDAQRKSILERYKHYNGTEGNSLGAEDASDGLYQSARSVPDVEDINQDNTLNEYERYFQYRVAIHPDSLEVGRGYITDKQVFVGTVRNGTQQRATWYQFTIPLRQYQKRVGSINDFSTIRFMRMFMTGFRETTHLRFATLELVRGEWRNYDYNLNMRGDQPATGSVSVNTVNIEENATREPVNYVLPPGVTRIVDSGSSQVTQLNEQSMQIKVDDLQAGDARGIYRNTSLDLRIYQRLQMFVHSEALIGDTQLHDGDVSVFIRLGSDVKNNYYEYEVPVSLTEAGRYNNNSTADRFKVWPEQNMLDIDLDVLTDVKKQRNLEKMSGAEGVSYINRYTSTDPNRPANRVTVLGNPSLSDVRVILIGVRNNASSNRSCVVWVDELRMTDFDNKGGWAAKAQATLGLSDIATVNVGYHHESNGFGSVDQSLSQRRLDDYNQYNVAVQVNLGRFLPEKVKLNAPLYYSYSNEKTTPKYNPLDQDVLLKDALEATETKHQRDSISAYAVTQRTTKAFSISGLKFDVKSKNPMPWDPANFTFSYSSTKTHLNDPNNTYENTNDYRGSLQYNWAPYVKPLKPFGWIDEKKKTWKFLRDWEFRWLPASIAFSTNISRYYYEQQTRNETDIQVELPVSVSKNFLWDRQFAITWNFTKSLSASFSSNTTAHILEPVGQVNKKLFPDRYRDWRDSVWRSIKDLGTPWAYNQTFNASYKAPFNEIPILSFITASATYNSTYRWDRGTTIGGVFAGNTVANQSSINLDGRMNLEQLYNKIPYLANVNKRFSGQGSTQRNNKAFKPKKFSRTFKLEKDTSIVIKHNMNVKKVKVTGMTTKGNKPVAIEFKTIDDNSVEILTRGDQNVKFTITEVKPEEKKNFWTEFGQYSTRLLMSVRSVSVRYRSTRSLSLPQFIPDVGDIFGQTTHYDVMAPGLDFAFGFTGEGYIQKAKDRGWLLCDPSMTTNAMYSNTSEFNAEVQLEPIRGLKITLTGNRTDNRTTQVQFMYDNMGYLYGGSYTKTHMAIKTALRGVKASDGYHSQAFDDFLAGIPVVAERLQAQYNGLNYPTGGFFEGTIMAGKPFDPANGTVNKMSSDVLIPAFLAAYSGKNPSKVSLNPFPGIKEILPNWRLTYDGLSKVSFLKKFFKNVTLTHAYQCTYAVGSFNSFTDWVMVGNGLGFTQDALTGGATPSSPYNISSVTLTEKFAPLIGLNATLNNGLTFNLEYRDGRTLTLNTAAGQVVEANNKEFVVGASYKIANFNSILKIKKKQEGVSNDLTLNLDIKYGNNNALIRKIEDASAQATSGTRTLSINFTANYVLSKRLTLGAYFDHQINTPLVSTTAYPTTNSNYGISVNLSLTK